MLRNTLLTIALAALSSAALVVPAKGQYQAPAPASATAQLTAKITAIDYNTRTVTLKDDQGNVRNFQATPEVTRFNELKVGDTVTFTYQESIAMAISKSGAQVPLASPSPVISRYPGKKPGGTISQTQTTTVTIKAIDPSKPSITVQTQDGSVISYVVKDKNILNGLNVGDVVQLTYSQALMISVK